jgi:N-acylglucosamine-6-phosphate 2-epimerase
MLVGQLAAQLKIPLLAEGRYKLPDQIGQALDQGALAVVVGGAITRPQEITRWFVEALQARD